MLQIRNLSQRNCLVRWLSNKSGFQLSVGITLVLLYYALWLAQKLAPPSQPIRCKTETDHDLGARIFPLGAGYVYLLWVLIGSLCWFWFYDTQLITALICGGIYAKIFVWAQHFKLWTVKLTNLKSAVKNASKREKSTITIFLSTSLIVINVPTRKLLAVEIKSSFV